MNYTLLEHLMKVVQASISIDVLPSHMVAATVVACPCGKSSLCVALADQTADSTVSIRLILNWPSLAA